MTAKRSDLFVDDIDNLTWAQVAEGHSNDPRTFFISALVVYLIDSNILPNEENITKILEFIRSLEASQCTNNN